MNKQSFKKTNTSYFLAVIMRRHISNRKLKEPRLLIRASPKEIGEISFKSLDEFYKKVARFHCPGNRNVRCTSISEAQVVKLYILYIHSGAWLELKTTSVVLSLSCRFR